jgi:plasmid stabilization system protein ParE
MKSGFKLLWSDQALADLGSIINYLSEKWTQRETQNFARRLDKRLNLIATNPELFPKTAKKKNVRRSVLTRQIVIYYTTNKMTINIVSLFDTRQNPKKLRV